MPRTRSAGEGPPSQLDGEAAPEVFPDGQGDRRARRAGARAASIGRPSLGQDPRRTATRPASSPRRRRAQSPWPGSSPPASAAAAATRSGRGRVRPRAPAGWRGGTAARRPPPAREERAEVRPVEEVGLAVMAVDRPLDGVAKLAAVALGERLDAEVGDGVVGQLDVGADLGRDRAGQPAGLGLDVVGPLAQRGDVQGQPLDAGEERQGQLARSPALLPGGGLDRQDDRGLGVPALLLLAQAAVLAVLEEGVEDRRAGGRQAVEVVQQDDPAPGRGDQAGPVLAGVGEGPRRWPKRMLRRRVSLVSSLQEATAIGGLAPVRSPRGRAPPGPRLPVPLSPSSRTQGRGRRARPGPPGSRPGPAAGPGRRAARASCRRRRTGRPAPARRSRRRTPRPPGSARCRSAALTIDLGQRRPRSPPLRTNRSAGNPSGFG